MYIFLEYFCRMNKQVVLLDKSTKRGGTSSSRRGVADNCQAIKELCVCAREQNCNIQAPNTSERRAEERSATTKLYARTCASPRISVNKIQTLNHSINYTHQLLKTVEKRSMKKNYKKKNYLIKVYQSSQNNPFISDIFIATTRFPSSCIFLT